MTLIGLSVTPSICLLLVYNNTLVNSTTYCRGEATWRDGERMRYPSSSTWTGGTRTTEHSDGGTLKLRSLMLQNSGVEDTSMLQDKRLLKGRTIEDSNCRTADYGV